MKEKALKRYAHFISILLNIVCIVFGVLSVSLFAGIVVIVCARLFFAGNVPPGVGNCC